MGCCAFCAMGCYVVQAGMLWLCKLDRMAISMPRYDVFICVMIEYVWLGCTLLEVYVIFYVLLWGIMLYCVQRYENVGS